MSDTVREGLDELRDLLYGMQFEIKTPFDERVEDCLRVIYNELLAQRDALKQKK